MKPDFISADHAVQLIKDGDTVVTVGMTLTGSPESIFKAVAQNFLSQQTPKDLTLLHAAGQADGVGGITHFAHEGLLKRVIGGHWGLAPSIMQLITDNKIIAFNLPQGQLAQLFRSMACGLPGKMSKVGLGTYIDPRVEGGKMNGKTKLEEDIVDLMEFDGEEYLFYRSIPIDCVIIRGTTADEDGNISCEDEPLKLELLSSVLATKRYGGKVIVQVKRTVKRGSLHPKRIVVPGYFVDAVVVSDNPEVDHRQSHSYFYDPALSGDLVIPETSVTPMPLTIRKVIGRRAISEVIPGTAINLGIGIPNDVIGSILVEEGLANDVLLTVESGFYGGIPEGGMDFGVARNTSALLEHTAQMDFYNGVGIPFAFMGAGEIDEHGHVNSTRFGDRCTGCGGFIDITQNAQHIIFCSTFTAQGLAIELINGALKIRQEGRSKKLVKQVAQISFNGDIARRNQQKVLYVTERAVFEMRNEGFTLVEIARGIDLYTDVLAQMEFIPNIADDLKEMDFSLYLDQPFGLQDKLFKKAMQKEAV